MQAMRSLPMCLTALRRRWLILLMQVQLLFGWSVAGFEPARLMVFHHIRVKIVDPPSSLSLGASNRFRQTDHANNNFRFKERFNWSMQIAFFGNH